jgi:hypothetical protein
MKPLHTALVVGGISAAIAWAVTYGLLHEPNLRWISDTELVWISDADNNEFVRASCWAAVAYVVTFTPTLLLLSRRVSRHVFQKDQTAAMRSSERLGYAPVGKPTRLARRR